MTSMGQEDENKRAEISLPIRSTPTDGTAARCDLYARLPLIATRSLPASLILLPVVFDEAENCLYAHKAILVHCLLR